MTTFTLTDHAGSYSWLWEGWEVEDLASLTDAQIAELVHVHAENQWDNVISSIEERSHEVVYPCFGYTTADVLVDTDQFVDYWGADAAAERGWEEDHARALMCAVRDAARA